MRVYLDHNATTPVALAVSDAVADTLRSCYGNASSIHFFGQSAKGKVDRARSDVAELVGGKPSEIVFTSGGTEADNLAIRGVAEVVQRSRHQLIASAIEHEAVLNTFKSLEKHGWTTTLLPVDQHGLIDPSDLENSLSKDTALVSVMHANNEIGTIQPIQRLAQLTHSHGALFHTDAVQSAGKIPINVQTLGVDLLSISAHKFNGPKGCGALWVKRGTRVVSTITGGRQERNRRAGTENVPAIVGMGVAARKTLDALDSSSKKIGSLRDKLELGILESVPNTVVNGASHSRISNTTNISFEGIEAEALLIALDLEGIAVSTGSACSSGTLEPSHVLKAMGFGSRRIQNSIRFSLGSETTDTEIGHVLSVIPTVVSKLRGLSRT